MKINKINKVGMFFVFIFLICLIAPLTSAETLQQGTDIPFTHLIRINGFPSDNIDANITITGPTENIIVGFKPMTYNSENKTFNFTFLGTLNNASGNYKRCITATGEGLNETKCFEFELNPSGKEYIPEISGPLMFGSIISLLFLSVFLLYLSLVIKLVPMKIFLMMLSGLFVVINLGFVAGSYQEFYSTSSALSSTYGSIYIVFVILMSAASIFLFFYLFLVTVKLYNTKRGFFISEDIN